MTSEHGSTKDPSKENPDRRQQDRRLYPRLPVIQGIPLKAVLETSDHILRDVRCVNLGSSGALLDFGEGKCPNLAPNSNIRVTLQLGSDTACIPAEIRYRTGDSVGVLFSSDRDPQIDDQGEALSLILRTLERGLARRGLTTTRIVAMENESPTDNPAPATATVSPVVPPTDRRQQERREIPRIPVLKGIPMKTQFVGSDKILRDVQCVNLGSRGALLDFGANQCPNFPQNSPLVVKLQLGSDVVSIPGVTRHRTPDRMGVFFPFDSDPQREEQEHALSLILRTLERAVARRKGSSSGS
jgi:hypothetical protein